MKKIRDKISDSGREFGGIDASYIAARRENEMPRARDSLSWPAELLPTRRADGVVLVLDRFDHQLLIDLNPPAPLNILAGQNTLQKRMSRR
jgi:hypothetical protein